MRQVIYTDRRGFRRLALVRNDDDDSMAEYGIPMTPDVVSAIDWDALKQGVNNIFVDAAVTGHMDAQRKKVYDQVASLTKRYVDAALRSLEEKTGG